VFHKFYFRHLAHIHMKHINHSDDRFVLFFNNPGKNKLI